MAFITGAAFQLRQAAVGETWEGVPFWVWVGLAAALAAGLAWGLRSTAARSAAVLVVAAAAGLGWAQTEARASARLAERLDPALAGEVLWLDGRVDELPRLLPGGLRFSFEVEAARRQPDGLGVSLQLPPRVLLAWVTQQADAEGAVGEAPPPPLRAGERWRLAVKLKPPHGLVNPGGFDAELWLFEQGWGATGSVVTRDPGRRLAPCCAARWDLQLAAWRQALRDRLLLAVPDPSLAGVLAGLAIGDQAGIARADWDVFRATGTAHLVSISGLHITAFAWVFGGIARRLWARHPRAPLLLPAPVAGALLGTLAAAAYAALAGWGVPAQRTVAMLAVVTALRLTGWRWPLPGVLLLAAVAVVAGDPWALLQPGFWLSFVAVGLLVASEAATPRRPEPASRLSGTWVRQALGGALRSQAVATVGLAPLGLLFFQQISVVGFVANLVAIPVVTGLLMPLSLLGLVWAPLWAVGAVVLQGLMAVLELLAAGPGALWTLPPAAAWAQAAGLIGGALLVLPLPWRLRWLGLPLMLPMLAPPVAAPPHGRFLVVAADVGQGTAVLVRTAGHALLFDTGPPLGPEADAGSRVLLPLLRHEGLGRLDRLVLSHRDADHTGGAASLLRALAVRRLDSTLEPGHPLLAQAAERATEVQPCLAGQGWTWDGVGFQWLHPTPADLAAARSSNAVSCVLRVHDAHGHSLLLTGDIEAREEAALLARWPLAALQATVLQVPHHGSRTSSTRAFLQAVAPRVGVVQAGYRSRYGHPAAEVMARYGEAGIQTVRSDQCGAWRWSSAEPAAQARCQRTIEPRYWRALPE